MSARFTQVGRPRALAMYADWTDRIAGGELPAVGAAAAAGPRAQRRHHDVGLGRSEGVSARRDRERQAQPDGQRQRADLRRARRERRLHARRRSRRSNTATQVKLEVRDPKTPSEADTPPAQPSAYWGDEAIWTSQSNAHSFAMDKQARVWIAARIRPNQTAAFCRAGFDPSVREGRSRSRRATVRCRCTIRRRRR